MIKVQFSNEAAVILENHTLELLFFFSQSAQVLLGTEIHCCTNTSVKQLPLYYTAFAFRVLLHD